VTDYYALLGVSRSATETEIRSAYGRDAMRLNEIAAPPEQHAALRSAFTTLVDPAARAAYDAQLASAPVASAETDGAGSFAYARNGALWFAGGCLLTAITYLIAGELGGRYFIAWGAVVFGGIQLVRGLLAYLGSGQRTQPQVLTLAGLIAVGVVSGGWVLADQLVPSAETAAIRSWNSAMDEADRLTLKADDLLDQFGSRSAWTDQDATDLGQVVALYSQAADLMERASIPAGYEWYRDGVVADYREAASTARAMLRLGAGGTEAEWRALGDRWDAWITDYNKLGDRFDAARK